MRPQGVMPVFTGGTVHADVEITLHVPPDTGDEAVSIYFGAEQLGLDFDDPDVLERLRDVADEGARVLRARIAADESGESDAEQQPAEQVG